MQEITFDDIVRDLKNLGVKQGDLLNVKVSLKSVGNVIGGAKTIIDALLDVVGEEGTIVTESYVRVYPLPLSGKHKIPVNDKTLAYTGAVANAILEYPNVVRSQHPVQKFAAIGKLAEELMLKHTADSYAYDVLRRMSEMGGKNINIGPAEKISDHGTGNVAIYKCNLHQKRAPMGVMYITAAGDSKVFKRNWSGDCFEGLKNFHKYYKPGGAVLGEGYIGNAQSLLTDMGKTLAIEMALLKKNPQFAFCNNPCCRECRLNWDCSDKKIFKFVIDCVRYAGIGQLLRYIKWNYIMQWRYKLLSRFCDYTAY